MPEHVCVIESCGCKRLGSYSRGLLRRGGLVRLRTRLPVLRQRKRGIAAVRRLHAVAAAVWTAAVCAVVLLLLIRPAILSLIWLLLRLGRSEDAIIVFGVLQVILGRYAVTRGALRMDLHD